jgi:hypothetical protein
MSPRIAPVLRPRSWVEILDAAFALLSRDYIKLVTLMAIGSLPVLIMQTWFEHALVNLSVSGALLSLPMFFFALFWRTLVEAAMIIAASDSYLGNGIDIAAALRGTVSRLGAVMLAAFLKVLAIAGGLLFFLIGAVVMWVVLFAVPATVVLEKRSATDGFRRSIALASGFGWKVFGTLLLVWMIYSAIVALPLVAVVFFARESTMLQTILTSVITVLAGPLLPLATTILYYDLRIRKEGLDLEMMSQDLPDATQIQAG